MTRASRIPSSEGRGDQTAGDQTPPSNASFIETGRLRWSLFRRFHKVRIKDWLQGWDPGFLRGSFPTTARGNCHSQGSLRRMWSFAGRFFGHRPHLPRPRREGGWPRCAEARTMTTTSALMERHFLNNIHEFPCTAPSFSKRTRRDDYCMYVLAYLDPVANDLESAMHYVQSNMDYWHTLARALAIACGVAVARNRDMRSFSTAFCATVAGCG
ncbi:hypothetical protein BU16DRAFT_396852 [Lophium mytilinum]|uniref:Uncharacterized protein n=1 Tax=Lophium mytilinum TaxID=390894 RepID=A0A6A6QUV0_9PEZI|nr:hypothetical protein BU16DRAFT_396852 [Lophium mytilinum]